MPPPPSPEELLAWPPSPDLLRRLAWCGFDAETLAGLWGVAPEAVADLMRRNGVADPHDNYRIRFYPRADLGDALAMMLRGATRDEVRDRHPMTGNEMYTAHIWLRRLQTLERVPHRERGPGATIVTLVPHLEDGRPSPIREAVMTLALAGQPATPTEKAAPRLAVERANRIRARNGQPPIRYPGVAE